MKADHAASHAGKALGLVTMIRGVRHNASHQRHVCLPTQLMIQVGTIGVLKGGAHIWPPTKNLTREDAAYRNTSYLLELKSNGRTEVSAFNEDLAEDAFLSCCRQHGVSQEDVIRGSEEQKMKDLVYDLASAAHGELEIVR